MLWLKGGIRGSIDEVDRLIEILKKSKNFCLKVGILIKQQNIIIFFKLNFRGGCYSQNFLT